MPVMTYSLKRDGDTQLSPYFKVKEFRCMDGSDAILVDNALVAAMQAVRGQFGKPIAISSAYRNAAYNAKIGGATDSQHKYGTAADIRIEGVDPREVARWAEACLFGKGVNGLGLYDYAKTDKPGFVHIDTRAGSKAQWVQTKSTAPTGYKVVGSITRDHLGASVLGTPAASDATNAAGITDTLRRGCKSAAVRELQEKLKAFGYDPGEIDGVFGACTEVAVKAFQSAQGLSVDGIAGAKTRAALGL